MYNGKIIKVLLKERRLLVKDLLDYLYPDPVKRNGSIKQLENGNPTVKTIEKVADFFKVPIDIFFNRTNYSSTKNEIDIRIECLKKILEEKDKRIEVLEQLNQLLSNKIQS